METFMYQRDIESITGIPVVSFCDVSDSEAQKLTEVIKKMYSLFPNMSGALTNISITNATTSSEVRSDACSTASLVTKLNTFVLIKGDLNLYKPGADVSTNV